MSNVSQWYANRSQSNTLRANTKPKASTLDIIKHNVALKKKIDAEDWSKIVNDHAPNQKDLVDETYHSVNSNIPSDYRNMATSPDKIHETIPEDGKGISTKMIHKSGDDYFMTKPYHAKRILPLAGWGIMTTNNLYRSAGLDNLVEKVGTVDINKIPVTVHHFAKDFISAADLPRGGPLGRDKGGTIPADLGATQPVGATPKTPAPAPQTWNISDKNDINTNIIPGTHRNINNIDPLQARQIGLMDFLTGNNDRHGHNLLVSNKNNKQGYKSLLAIDHDRSFTYKTTSFPHDDYEDSAMARHLGDNAGQESTDHDKKLSTWWDKNHQGVYHEMNRNLNAIKDYHLRNYVRKNFDKRYQMISEWSKTYDDHKESFFARNPNSIIQSHPRYHIDNHSIEKIKEALPKDSSVKSIELLTDIIKKPDNEPQQQYAASKAASDILKSAPIDDMISVFSKFDTDPRIKNFKNDVLMDMKIEPHKNAHKIKKLLEVNKSLPPDSRFLNEFWQSHLEDVINAHDRGVAV